MARTACISGSKESKLKQVMPLRACLGTWQTLAVWKAADLIQLPMGTGMAPEHAALALHFCLAYRLLEDFGSLKVPSLPNHFHRSKSPPPLCRQPYS